VAASSLFTAAQEVGIVPRHPKLRGAAGSELKFARQNTGDGIRNIGKNNRLSDHIRAPAEAVLPCGKAEQNRMKRTRRILTCIEVASKDRSDAKRAEEPIAHASAQCRLCACGSTQQIGAEAPDIQRTEKPGAILPVTKVEIRNITARARCGRLKYGYEPSGIPIGQRLDQRRIHKSENGHTGRHAESQHEDGRRGESWIFPQLPDRKANILRQVVNQVYPRMSRHSSFLCVKPWTDCSAARRASSRLMPTPMFSSTCRSR